MKKFFTPVSKFINQLFTEKSKEQIKNEVFLLTLSRTTSADTNIRHVELEKVQELLKKHLGHEYSEAEIRVAAMSRGFEKEPLHRFVAKASKTLSQEDRLQLAFGMMDIMKSDGRVGNLERKHYDRMIESLGLSASSLMEHAA